MEPLPPERAHGRNPLALQLAFDSFREPAPVGIRGGRPPDRHLVYFSSEFAVELHLQEADCGGMLSGELLSRCDGPVAEAAAFLLDGDEITGYDCTGPLGEFRLATADAAAPRLCLLVDTDRCIDLRVDLGRPAGGRF